MKAAVGAAKELDPRHLGKWLQSKKDRVCGGEPDCSSAIVRADDTKCEDEHDDESDADV
jgi:hypothetical protein